MDETTTLRESIDKLRRDLASAHTSLADAYLQGYNDGIAHAAQYVEHHCQNGDEHANAIIRLMARGQDTAGETGH